MDRTEPSVWSLLWSIGLIAAGIVLLGWGWSTLPPGKTVLTVVEQIGPPSVTTELIREYSRRGDTTYRTQRIALQVPGKGVHIVSPARTLWVGDLDTVRRDQAVRYLVDLDQQIVFEATTDGRTLLAYEQTAGNRTGYGRALMIIGLIMLVIGAFQLAPLWRQQ
ncbi:hypothetical protein E8L99_08105 [Phreatobacter aquaticus]|uniref:DUF3592 domain-containing protein n=1 Tax=Phreatobacter aquaticus TaxID=2570229 RepID=A0A4D7QEX4_9HYPH|nr:hypothetical protein [Phreatobacter aquaticus]QCK85728.1 hypothetical protein E8L99_08105 [Phreatobacter aquaticus]